MRLVRVCDPLPPFPRTQRHAKAIGSTPCCMSVGSSGRAAVTRSPRSRGTASRSIRKFCTRRPNHERLHPHCQTDHALGRSYPIRQSSLNDMSPFFRQNVPTAGKTVRTSVPPCRTESSAKRRLWYVHKDWPHRSSLLAGRQPSAGCAESWTCFPSDG